MCCSVSVSKGLGGKQDSGEAYTTVVTGVERGVDPTGATLVSVDGTW
jgi:hypothetical protein